MPHKHKRKRDVSPSSHDLPPTSRARPLSIHKKSDPIFTADIDKRRKFEARKQRKEQKKGSEYKSDDTPKAFKRLMAFQEGKKTRNGLDDGMSTSSKKRKRTTEAAMEARASKPGSASNGAPERTENKPEPTEADPPATTLKIQPSESLSSFALRVDQSLPLTSLPKHNQKAQPVTDANGKPLPGLKPYLTKHNKRLARMQKEWRATEQRLRAKEEEQAEELADQKEEDSLLWLGAGVDPSNPKGRKKRGRGRDVDDVDPWKVLEKKRREEGSLKQKGLQDVVSAPPVLKPLKNIFKEKGDAGGGGLRGGGTSRAVMA
jgi:hypothetical protein